MSIIKSEALVIKYSLTIEEHIACIPAGMPTAEGPLDSVIVFRATGSCYTIYPLLSTFDPL